MRKFNNLLLSRQLLHFAAIAQSESLNKAAEDIGFTQSALTRSLKMLEDGLGVKLVDRGPRGSALTVEGSLLLDCVHQIDLESHLALQAISHRANNDQILLRIGASTAVGMVVLPSAIAVFRERHEDIRFDVHQAAPVVLLNELIESNIDMYMGPLPASVPVNRLEFREFADGQSAIYARADHELAGKKDIQLDALLKYNWIALAGTETTTIIDNWRDILVSYAYEMGLAPPKVEVETTSIVGALNLAARTNLLVCLSSILAGDAEHRFNLTTLDLREPLTRNAIGIAYRKSARGSPVHLEFAELLGEMLQEASAAS